MEICYSVLMVSPDVSSGCVVCLPDENNHRVLSTFGDVDRAWWDVGRYLFLYKNKVRRETGMAVQCRDGPGGVGYGTDWHGMVWHGEGSWSYLL
jgi:hypothetical protein